jgi:hypothetical protein
VLARLDVSRGHQGSVGLARPPLGTALLSSDVVVPDSGSKLSPVADVVF